jgi:hypothetical protein
MVEIEASEVGKSAFPWTRDRGNPGRKPRHNLSHPFRGTGVRDLKRVGTVVIGKLEFLRIRKLGHQKSRNPRGIETVHLEGTRGGDRRHRERADKEASIGV